MIVDAFARYNDSQLITSTAPSTNVIDHGQANPNLNIGGEGILYLIVLIDVTMTAAGAATLDIALQDSADNVTFADTPVKIIGIPVASLVSGYMAFLSAVPMKCRRYTRINYTVNTGPMTAGSCKAFLTSTPDAWISYPRGYAVSGA